MPTEQTDSADCSESEKNAGHGRIARRIGMHGISHTVHSGRAANRRHTSQTAAETAGGSAVSPNSIDAAGGVQSGHTAGRAMHIAEYAPQLRKWLVANPSATPAMLDYLAQVGGPDVARALQILLESLESCGSQACS